jgi:hypothetical protein
VDLNADEWTSDINNVAGLLKMWLRELPDPLMTKELQAGFLEAASAYCFHLRRRRRIDRSRIKKTTTIALDTFDCTSESTICPMPIIRRSNILWVIYPE